MKLVRRRKYTRGQFLVEMAFVTLMMGLMMAGGVFLCRVQQAQCRMLSWARYLQQGSHIPCSGPQWLQQFLTLQHSADEFSFRIHRYTGDSAAGFYRFYEVEIEQKKTLMSLKNKMKMVIHPHMEES